MFPGSGPDFYLTIPVPNLYFTAPGNKTSWWRHNNVSLYVSATLQVCLKWNTQGRLGETSSTSLSGTSWRISRGRNNDVDINLDNNLDTYKNLVKIYFSLPISLLFWISFLKPSYSFGLTHYRVRCSQSWYLVTFFSILGPNNSKKCSNQSGFHTKIMKKTHSRSSLKSGKGVWNDKSFTLFIIFSYPKALTFLFPFYSLASKSACVTFPLL